MIDFVFSKLYNTQKAYMEGIFVMSVSERIRVLRKKNGLSQEQLADKLGVFRQAKIK